MKTIILNEPPVSTQTIYKFTCTGNFPRQYMTQRGHDTKERYQWAFKTQWKGDLTFKPVELNVRLYFKDKLRRDIDNFNKLILDSMTGIVFDDDSQISKITIEKFIDKKNPHTEVEIIYGKI